MTERFIHNQMYDADGNRLSATTVGAKGRTLRLYCGRYQYDVAMTFPRRSYETFYTSNGYLQNGFMRYYVTDYLGNVRAVVSEDGTVEQSSHYYPYGALMDESLGEDTQPYLFGGKELENMMSLGQYDFGARSYTAVAPAFGRPDPHAANTPQLSPYIYCASNPVAYRDPDGEDAILSIQGNTITIKANVILTGELATNELAQIYQQGINDVWGAIKKVKFRGETFDVVWDVNVRVMAEGETEIFDGVNNYMEVFDPETRDFKNKKSKVTNSNNGEIRSKSFYDIPLEYDNPMPHEFGHMLGLRDRYKDGDKNNNIYNNEVMKEMPIDIPTVSLQTQYNLFLFPVIINRTFNKDIPYQKNINILNSEAYFLFKGSKAKK